MPATSITRAKRTLSNFGESTLNTAPNFRLYEAHPRTKAYWIFEPLVQMLLDVARTCVADFSANFGQHPRGVLMLPAPIQVLSACDAVDWSRDMESTAVFGESQLCPDLCDDRRIGGSRKKVFCR